MRRLILVREPAEAVITRVLPPIIQNRGLSEKAHHRVHATQSQNHLQVITERTDQVLLITEVQAPDRAEVTVHRAHLQDLVTALLQEAVAAEATEAAEAAVAVAAEVTGVVEVVPEVAEAVQEAPPPQEEEGSRQINQLQTLI